MLVRISCRCDCTPVVLPLCTLCVADPPVCPGVRLESRGRRGPRPGGQASAAHSVNRSMQRQLIKHTVRVVDLLQQEECIADIHIDAPRDLGIELVV